MSYSNTYVVAITRWGRPPEDEADSLAPLLRLSSAEARAHLTGPLPVIVATNATPDGASGARRTLRERGHGVVACERESVTPSSEMVAPRDFEFGPLIFTGTDPARGRGEIAYAEIVGLVWATHVRKEMTTTTSSSRRFSAGRVVMTGGLSSSKSVSTTKQVEEDLREGVVYLFSRTGTGHQILRETILRYGGLGAKKAPTKLENFKVTLELLRQRAPEAFFDARLATSPARATPIAAGMEGGIAAALPSNVEATDLAAHLITVARLQGQL